MDVLRQVLDFVRDQIHDHWLKFLMGLAFMAIGWMLGKRRARAEWRKKEFFSRLNVSLNIIQPGQPLLIRTLIEKSCDDIFLNKVAVETIIAAARKTTSRNPILPLPKDDYWYYLNAVLNEMAEKFALGELKRDLGQPIVSARYLICLTSEHAGTLRTHKIRAMTIRKDVLTALPAERPPLERTWHDTRWETLKILAEQYQANPDEFMEVELAV
jgi:hypothetical protein